MYDVIIVGSGPAGLAASIYAKRAGLKAVTIEKNFMSGGQVLNTYEVDNYPGLPGINGFDMGMKFREHADKLECEFQTAEVLEIRKNVAEDAGLRAGEGEAAQENPGKAAPEAELKAAAVESGIAGTDSSTNGFIVVTDQGELETKTVLAAMGASHAKLGIPGEEELSGMGVSYCATCDGAFFKGKVTAVIGGGDVAVEDAIFLARGCSKVYLIHRRDELRAASVLQKEVMSLPNVEILWDTVAEKIEGEDQVEALQIKNVKTGKTDTLPLDGVFVAVGIIPASEVFQNVAECDEKGYLIAGEDGATKTPGIFAAGDVRTKKLRQIVTAVADGANAITTIQDYLLTC
ncbi:MAG: FAD-dependent oxidoreductase [Lachnospiraceae bacterium]|nr:FAD-dependent oxidoreductase [Lachnospiraceae bacterium]